VARLWPYLQGCKDPPNGRRQHGGGSKRPATAATGKSQESLNLQSPPILWARGCGPTYRATRTHPMAGGGVVALGGPPLLQQANLKNLEGSVNL